MKMENSLKDMIDGFNIGKMTYFTLRCRIEGAGIDPFIQNFNSNFLDGAMTCFI